MTDPTPAVTGLCDVCGERAVGELSAEMAGEYVVIARYCSVSIWSDAPERDAQRPAGGGPMTDPTPGRMVTVSADDRERARVAAYNQMFPMGDADEAKEANYFSWQEACATADAVLAALVSVPEEHPPFVTTHVTADQIESVAHIGSYVGEGVRLPPPEEHPEQDPTDAEPYVDGLLTIFDRKWAEEHWHDEPCTCVKGRIGLCAACMHSLGHAAPIRPEEPSDG